MVEQRRLGFIAPCALTEGRAPSRLEQEEGATPPSAIPALKLRTPKRLVPSNVIHFKVKNMCSLKLSK